MWRPWQPLMGIYAAATRRTLDGKHPDGWVPEQKITVARGHSRVYDGVGLRQLR